MHIAHTSIQSHFVFRKCCSWAQMTYFFLYWAKWWANTLIPSSFSIAYQMNSSAKHCDINLRCYGLNWKLICRTVVHIYTKPLCPRQKWIPFWVSEQIVTITIERRLTIIIMALNPIIIVSFKNSWHISDVLNLVRTAIPFVWKFRNNQITNFFFL